MGETKGQQSGCPNITSVGPAKSRGDQHHRISVYGDERALYRRARGLRVLNILDRQPSFRNLVVCPAPRRRVKSIFALTRAIFLNVRSHGLGREGLIAPWASRLIIHL